MASFLTTAGVRLCNNSAHPVRLRFRCDGRAAWDGWCVAGGELAIPQPQPVGLVGAASWRDPVSQVCYGVPARPAGPGTRLVARVRNAGRALLFDCESGPGKDPEALELLNETAATAQFELAFPGTPFAFTCPVEAGALVRVRPGEFDLTVTLAGISCRAVPVSCWHGIAEVTTRRLRDHDGPQLRFVG